jgi:D-alanyl-lipoteichoic acid acyltransferase DltB (MBOAT superfamily)
MLFNSFEFAVFMIVLLALVPFFPRGKPRNALLLVASYVFYGSWNWGFLLLIWFTTLLDYYCGGAMATADSLWKKRVYLYTSLSGNLGFLFYFKYGNFFLDNVAFVSGIDPSPFYLNVVIPLGISFYTFHTMTYTIDRLQGTRGRLRLRVQRPAPLNERPPRGQVLGVGGSRPSVPTEAAQDDRTCTCTCEAASIPD